jgi:hypothetical protein
MENVFFLNRLKQVNFALTKMELSQTDDFKTEGSTKDHIHDYASCFH